MVGKHLAALRERARAVGAELRFTFEQTAVLAVLALLALTGGLLAAREARPLAIARASESALKDDLAAFSATTKGSGDKSQPQVPKKTPKKKLLVHVAGDVANPGLHRLTPGARVADAIDAAGGPTNAEALDKLNLAAKVSDGQKVMVGEAPAGSGVASADPALPGAIAAETRIGINSAGPMELERLDGIGPVLASRIVAWRERQGRFETVSQLKKVAGIGPKKYAGLKEQVLID